MGSGSSSTVDLSDQRIKYVIILSLENRSFDQILGYRSNKPPPFTVDGVNWTEPYFNIGRDGVKYEQKPIVKFEGEDYCSHDLEDTLPSIGEKRDMSGFVASQQCANFLLDPNDKDAFKGETLCPPAEVMGFFPEGSLPVIDYLADNFLVCDKWFASVPSATFSNRIFAITADSKGETFNSCKEHHVVYDQPSIFDRLNDANVPWKVYWNDIPGTFLLKNQRIPKNLKNYRHFNKFKDDVTSGQLPYLSVIEPDYTYESLNSKTDPYKHMIGERLIATVYDIVRSNDSIWESCLIFFYYDENGGFYDHVPPPKAVPPHDNINSEGKYGDYPHWTFDLYGVRIPAILISPWVPAGVSSQIYDHTSVLAFILRTLGLQPLTNRDAQANYFTDVLLTSRREVEYQPLLPIFEAEARRDYPIEATIRYHTPLQENGVITVLLDNAGKLLIEGISSLGVLEEELENFFRKK